MNFTTFQNNSKDNNLAQESQHEFQHPAFANMNRDVEYINDALKILDEDVRSITAEKYEIAQQIDSLSPRKNKLYRAELERYLKNLHAKTNGKDGIFSQKQNLQKAKRNILNEYAILTRKYNAEMTEQTIRQNKALNAITLKYRNLPIAEKKQKIENERKRLIASIDQEKQRGKQIYNLKHKELKNRSERIFYDWKKHRDIYQADISRARAEIVKNSLGGTANIISSAGSVAADITGKVISSTAAATGIGAGGTALSTVASLAENAAKNKIAKDQNKREMAKEDNRKHILDEATELFSGKKAYIKPVASYQNISFPARAANSRGKSV